MLGSARNSTWSSPTTSPAASAQMSLTRRSLTTESVPEPNARTISARLASAIPRATCSRRSRTFCAVARPRVRSVPRSATRSGITFALLPPAIAPNETTVGSRESNALGIAW